MTRTAKQQIDRRIAMAVLLLAALGSTHDAASAEPVAATAEARAIGWLSLEVPKWKQEHACYSCHNNGDAARALLLAHQLGELPDRAVVADTVRFLMAPTRWAENGPDGPFKDEKLERLQFAAALVAARDAKLGADALAVEEAAALVAALVQPDGSWQTGGETNLGSPVTYGQHLATAMAVRLLQAANSPKFADAIERAQRWFESTSAPNVMSAAATLWGLSDARDNEAVFKQREVCKSLLLKAQSTDGGWGPYVTAPPEVFDTSLVLIALSSQENTDNLPEVVKRGRAFLAATQRPDGSWPATTRPTGGDSYAQTISTTGWALQALLMTRR